MRVDRRTRGIRGIRGRRGIRGKRGLRRVRHTALRFGERHLQGARRCLPAVLILLTALLAVLSGCSVPGVQGPPPGSAGQTALANAITALDPNQQNSEAWQRTSGPDAWAYKISIPQNRIILYYGAPLSGSLGILGQLSQKDLVTQVQAQADAYTKVDPAHPAIAGFDYITPVAAGDPADDGLYIHRSSDDSIQTYVNLAAQNHLLFFADMQLGHSTVQRELPLLWKYLQEPNVSVALDAEWDLYPNLTPIYDTGHMHAADIQWTIDELSNLVLTRHLPPKILIVHEYELYVTFPDRHGVPEWRQIQNKPGVTVVISIDGFGTRYEKVNEFNVLARSPSYGVAIPDAYSGMKSFFTGANQDNPHWTAQDFLQFDPQVSLVSYE
jgi:hypothetical protein